MPIHLHRYGCRCTTCRSGATRSENPETIRRQLEQDAKDALATAARQAAARKAAATRAANAARKRKPK